MNFDRIAHLAKLVFNTKGVMVSLIDSNEQYASLFFFWVNVRLIFGSTGGLNRNVSFGHSEIFFI